MKPAFALSLSDNGITLLHYSDDEWFGIGTVSLDAPDFSEQLNELRGRGFALANDLSCTVVIPSDHVRYLTVASPDGSDVTQVVEAELAQATGCEIAELMYDLRADGSDLLVAAVAKETIDEARAFASRYGFVPVRFAATLAPDTPWTGTGEFEFAERATSVTQPPEPPVEEIDTVAPAEDAEPAPQASQASEADPAPSPQAHPIAEPAQPDVFVSPIEATETAAQYPAASNSGIPVRYIGAAAAGAVVLAVAALIWSGSDETGSPVATAPVVETAPAPVSIAAPPLTETEAEGLAEVAPQPEDTPDPEAMADEDLTFEASTPLVEPETPTPPELTPTDQAILEALNVAPSPVEQVERDPESVEDFEEASGLTITAPDPLPVPDPEVPEDVYLSSVDHAELSQDAVALPAEESFDTDEPVATVGLPNVAGSRFDLDDRGLVTPTPEGTLNPDGILVFLGRPSSVPPEVPVRFETDPTATDDDTRLAGLRPRLRPETLVENFERGQLGGRTVDELAVIRPKSRPASIQEREAVDRTPTALAVVRVPRPRVRPSTVAALAARKATTGSATLGSTAAVAKADDDEAGSFKPTTVAPKIPSRASVARQATIDNALNLRRLNLIGVYGTPANRRALVRLPSGRYKKLKVGDRIDGGKVVAIGDSELRYQKGGRNVTLKMPRG
ncbi:hypothetical protein [Ruegeria arenilitoris]|uniref:hypothetical protein n=1 Tax=Ruegeria arenilitoris TaxID=1173585 RepID=UPI00147BE518|nr:hypothetical protein [Ruegeria arenilitoris]